MRLCSYLTKEFKNRQALIYERIVLLKNLASPTIPEGLGILGKESQM